MSFAPCYAPVPVKDLVRTAHKQLANTRRYFEKHPWKNHPVTEAVELQRLEHIVTTLERLQYVIGPDAIPETHPLLAPASANGATHETPVPVQNAA